MRVEIDGGRTAFRPGEEIRGVASWSLDEEPTSVELRLFWRTEGKGIPDVGVVETVGFDGAGRMDRREFRVRLPDRPYSFTGRLVSLIWAVEVVAEPGGFAGSQDLVLPPTGEPIVLSAL